VVIQTRVRRSATYRGHRLTRLTGHSTSVTAEQCGADRKCQSLTRIMREYLQRGSFRWPWPPVQPRAVSKGARCGMCMENLLGKIGIGKSLLLNLCSLDALK